MKTLILNFRINVTQYILLITLYGFEKLIVYLETSAMRAVILMIMLMV